MQLQIAQLVLRSSHQVIGLEMCSTNAVRQACISLFAFCPCRRRPDF